MFAEIGLAAQPCHGEECAVGLLRLGRVHVGDLAAHHHADHFLARGLGGVDRADHVPVAQHRDLVGHMEDLVQLVRDKDDGNAAGGQVVDDRVEAIDLLLRQGRRGLVHDDDLGVKGERLADLHHLLHAHAQLAGQGLGVEVDAQAVEDRAGVGIQLLPADRAEAR